MDFAVPVDYKVKIKENDKREVLRPCQSSKKGDEAWKWPFVSGSLGMILKGLTKWREDLEIEERAETIQTAALRLARILRIVLKTWGDWLALKLQWKTYASVKNWQEIIIIISECCKFVQK